MMLLMVYTVDSRIHPQSKLNSPDWPLTLGNREE